MNIILIGYMGSGKSTIGKNVAVVLDFKYLDLDDVIEESEGTTISEIFKSKGEIYFRKIESTFLENVLNINNNTVISLGGGTPCYGNNIELIKNSKNASSIYLKASITTLAERLFLERHKRPLISHLDDVNELTEFIGKHLFERSFYYAQSDLTINTDTKTTDEVVESIVINLF
jgi:shikimate kinase